MPLVSLFLLKVSFGPSFPPFVQNCFMLRDNSRPRSHLFLPHNVLDLFLCFCCPLCPMPLNWTRFLRSTWSPPFLTPHFRFSWSSCIYRLTFWCVSWSRRDKIASSQYFIVFVLSVRVIALACVPGISVDVTKLILDVCLYVSLVKQLLPFRSVSPSACPFFLFSFLTNLSFPRNVFLQTNHNPRTKLPLWSPGPLGCLLIVPP